MDCCNAFTLSPNALAAAVKVPNLFESADTLLPIQFFVPGVPANEFGGFAWVGWMKRPNATGTPPTGIAEPVTVFVPVSRTNTLLLFMSVTYALLPSDVNAM